MNRAQTEITVYGRRAVLEALASESVETSAVTVAEQTPAPFRKELGAACRARGVELATGTYAEVGRLSGDARNDQGVVARIRLRNVMEVETFLEGLTGAGAAKPARLVALDGVTNPQNVGMIVRSAAAAGLAGILWPAAGAPWVSGLIIKASAATVYRFPIVRCHTLAEGLYALKAGGFTLAGLSSEASRSLFDYAPAHRACFVVGSETEGLSREIEELMDEQLSIPMAPEVESLNVAAAATLVCFAAAGALPRGRATR